MLLALIALFTMSSEAATLEEALAAADSQSVDLGLLRARTDATRALPGQAWSLLAPKVVASGQYQWNNREIALDFAEMVPPEFQDLFPPGDPIVVQPKRYAQGSITVQQSLFSGEALPLLMGAYRMVDAAEHDELRLRSQLHLGVVQAYYGVLTAREGEALAVEAEKIAEDGLALAKRARLAETTNDLPVFQAELGLSQAHRDVQAAHAGRLQAEEAFTMLTGLPRDTAVELPAPPQVPDDLEAAVLSARTERPDILAADDRILAARLQTKAHWAGWAPDITGRFTQVYTENTGFAANNKTPWMVVVEGQWVLWDGGYRLAKAREYAAQTHMAELAKDKAALTAESEVRNAWEKYARATKAAEATEREVELADKTLELAKRSFEAEQVPWIQVDQAEVYVKKAHLDRSVERMNRDVAAYELLVAAGRW
jgi:outer membrane protein TolC